MSKQICISKLFFAIFIAVLLMTFTLTLSAAKLPASKTTEQQILEEKEAQEESVTTEESLSSEQAALEVLPADTSTRYTLSKIVISGNTLFTDEQLLENIPETINILGFGLTDLSAVQAFVADPEIPQEITARNIQGLTQHILSVYQNKHYGGIYAYVPQEALEDLSQGTLHIQVMEASVTNVSSAYYDPNNQSVEEGYLRAEALHDWSPVKEGQVMNRKKLDDYVNLLNLNPDRYISAMVSKGTEPNSLAVKYNVYEANPWHYFVQVDNSGTEDTQWRPRFGLINTNLLGYDDKLTAVYQVTPDTTWDETYAIFGSYDFPIMGPKLRLTIYGGYSEFNIPDPDVGSFFGAGRFVGGILRYNALQFDDWFWDVTGSISYEESEISNELFAAFPEFNLGTDINMTLWGLGTELYKTTDLKETFFGFNTYGLLDSSDPAEMSATRTGGASDDFHIYQLSGRHSRYLDADKIERFTSSVRVIIADDRLVPAKMTSFGGMYTIRGYDEADTVADGGLIASLQYEYDLVRSGQIEMFAQDVDEETRKPFLKKLAPLAFFDYGQAWIEDPAGSEHEDTEFASVGCGIITELGDNFTGTVYYGHPLISTDDTNTDDGRVHVGLLLRW